MATRRRESPVVPKAGATKNRSRKYGCGGKVSKRSYKCGGKLKK